MTTMAHIQIMVAKNHEKYADERNYKIFITVSTVILTLFFIIRAYTNWVHLRREKTNFEKTINDLKASLVSVKAENRSLKVEIEANKQLHKNEINALTTAQNAKIDALQKLVDYNTKKYDDVISVLSQNELNQQQRHNEALNTNLATNALAKFAINRAGSHEKRVVRKVKKPVRKLRIH